MNHLLLHAAHAHQDSPLGILLSPLLEWIQENLGEAWAEFVLHFVTDSLNILLILLVVMFASFFLQTYLEPERLRSRLVRLKSLWGYGLAALLGMFSPFCSCSIVPVLMGLVTVGVPVPVCLCMMTSASLLNVTAVAALYGVMGPGYATAYLACSALLIAGSSLIMVKFPIQHPTRDFSLAHTHPHHHEKEGETSHRSRLALHSTVRVLRGCWAFILLGVAFSAGLQAFFPLERLSQVISSNSLFSTLAAAAVGFPLHSDVFSILPLLRLFRELYLPVSLTFTLAAMAVSVPSAVLLGRVFRPKVVALYLGSLMALTLALGIGLVWIVG